jgi:hypothetical protein
MIEPLLNLKDYTPFEMFLFAGGCFLWVVVYVIYIINGKKYKFIEMPVFAASGNIGWEFTWSWLHRTDMGLLLVWTYRAWFFLDVFIFSDVLRHGRKQVTTPAIQAYFVPIFVAAAVFWAVAVHFFVQAGYDTTIGANSAYIAQMGISILYVILLLRQTSLVGWSWAVAWLKMIGTGMNTVFMCIHPAYADNHFLHFLAVTATTIDCAYIVIFWQMRRRLAGNVAAVQV